MKKSFTVIITLCLLLTGLGLFYTSKNTSVAYAAKGNNNEELFGSWICEEEEVLFQFNNDLTGVFTDCQHIEEFTFFYNSSGNTLTINNSDYFRDTEFLCYINGNGMIFASGTDASHPDEIYIFKKL